MPSTTTRGWFWPRIDPAPRDTMREEPNGLLELVTYRPATLPWRAESTFVVGTFVNTSPDTLCAEYGRVRDSRSMPSAVVTTGSSCIAWNDNATATTGATRRTSDRTFVQLAESLAGT